MSKDVRIRGYIFSKAKGVPEQKRLGNNGVRYLCVSPAGNLRCVDPGVF